MLMTPSATIDIRGAILIAGYVTPAWNQVAWRMLERQAQPAYALAAFGYTTTVTYEHASMRSFTDQAPVPFEANSSAMLQLAQNVNQAAAAGLSPGLYVQVLDGTNTCN